MKLAEIFCDGMVLQANKPIRLFGTGKGKVTARMGSACVGKLCSGDRWSVELPACTYGGPYEIALTLDGEEKVLRNVWIGDVYLFAGQSNMQLKLCETNYPADAYSSHDNLFLYSTRRVEGGESFFPEDGWVPCAAATAGNWSALAYLAGIHLADDHKVGIVTCYQGAAAIQAFLPDDVFAQEPELDLPAEDRFDMAYPWNAGHSQLYHALFEPQIMPFSFGAVVWYQGESNCSEKESHLYGIMLTRLIDTWRRDLHDDALPFVIIQIADCIGRLGPTWSRIQQAQLDAAQTVPHVTTVISRDVCEADDIHPRNKDVLGERIAAALRELN